MLRLNKSYDAHALAVRSGREQPTTKHVPDGIAVGGKPFESAARAREISEQMSAQTTAVMAAKTPSAGEKSLH